MPTAVWIAIGVVVLADLILMPIIIGAAIKNSIGAIATRFPAVEPARDAVMKEFQSFRFGMVNLGKCIHVAVDERHLHLLPAKFARLFGAKAASVPWEEVWVERKVYGTFMRARIAGQQVLGPEWCLKIADESKPVAGAAEQ